jgi:mono/diheme cytochrome c family protein
MKHVFRNASVLVAALMLSACAVEVQNTLPAKTLAKQSKPAGSVYAGWRLFQNKCASCHGPAAEGSGVAPDLLPRVLRMGPHQFVDTVLKRYDWNMPAAQAQAGSREREALIEDLVQGRGNALLMPAWQAEPSVNAHIADLYAYLFARAQGTQGSGRPVQ